MLCFILFILLLLKKFPYCRFIFHIIGILSHVTSGVPPGKTDGFSWCAVRTTREASTTDVFLGMYEFFKTAEAATEVFRKKVVLKNFVIFTRKHLCWRLFGVFGVNFIKKSLQHRYFLVNITKFLRTHILKNIWERLPLKQLF